MTHPPSPDEPTPTGAATPEQEVSPVESPHRRVSGYAQLALILAILVTVLPVPLLWQTLLITSTVCCALAYFEIRRNTNRLNGYGWILVAIVLGVIGWGGGEWVQYDMIISPTKGYAHRLEQDSSQRLAIRAALADFHQDTGVYPATLDDLTKSEETTLATPIPKGTFHGPYLPLILPNPFADLQDTHKHWRYDPATGRVTSAVTIDYAAWRQRHQIP
jgi:hypothetical protein